MNERIQELALQARIKEVFRLRIYGTIDALTDTEQEDLESIKDFAELIVRECIDIVSPYAIRMENFDGGHPIDDLKKHFGVEP